jgi:hypothetical protein
MIGGSTGGQFIAKALPTFLGLFDTHVYSTLNTFLDYDMSKAAVPYAGVMSNFTVYLSGQAGSNNALGYQFTVIKNSLVSQAILQCTALGATRICSDTVNSLSFAAGDTISITADPVGTPAEVALHWTAKYVGN